MDLFSFSVESVHKTALTVGFIGAALAALGAGVTLWTGAILSKDSNTQIEQARATAERARESSNRLEIETEKLKTKNLKLEIELEKERTKRDELQLRLGPRNLTSLQVEMIRDALAPLQPNTVTAEIYWDHGDEIQSYAIQIATALRECGINIHRIKTGRIISSGRPTHGVGVTVLGGMGNELLSEALSAAQIATDTVIEKPPSTHNSLGRIGLPYNQCAVSIHVMPKPPSI